MKTNKFLTLILSFVAVLAITSCVEDDDFSVPNTLGNEESAGLNTILAGLEDGSLQEISLSALKALYVGETTLLESDIVVKGYVSSSDASGNFYKEFYIQDAPENPTAAIGVVLNQADTYNQFNKGREVYIKLKGLYLGENSSDVVTIGGEIDGINVEQMTQAQIPAHLFRSSNTMEIVPMLLTPSTVNDSHLGIFAMFENVQFPATLEGTTFVDPYDDFDTQRDLVSCDTGGSFALETSSFANFKQEPLPIDGRGSIAGVITQSFGGSPRVMVLNTTADINFDNPLRCDPLFEDSFTQGNLSKWTPYNVLGAQEWYYNSFGNPNDSATMSGYAGGNQNNEDWLISLPIDLSSVPSAFVSFQSVKRYAGPDLEVFYATDYQGGDPTTDGTWTPLAAALDTDINSWNSWTDSGSLDVSSAAGGNLFIAFKYTSTTSGSSTYEIDNVKVSAE